MMIKFQLTNIYPSLVEEVFKYLVYLKECDQWMDYEVWNGVYLLIKEGKYAGFVIPNPEQRMAPLVSEVEQFVLNEFIVYRPAGANDSNIPSGGRTFFPFKEMKQSMYFRPHNEGCEVLHIVEFLPNGIIGFITCKFILVPFLRRGMNKNNLRLAKHLSKV